MQGSARQSMALPHNVASMLDLCWGERWLSQGAFKLLVNQGQFWGFSNNSDTITGAMGGRWHAVMDQFLSLCARHTLGGHAGEKIKMRKLEGQNMSW